MTKSKKTADRTKATADTKVYCGPTIHNICTRYTMFTEAPAPLMEKAKQVPLIRNLIIPLADFVEARQQIEARRGSYYNIYQQIKKSL